jgi:hypothetical protein
VTHPIVADLRKPISQGFHGVERRPDLTFAIAGALVRGAANDNVRSGLYIVSKSRPA